VTVSVAPSAVVIVCTPLCVPVVLTAEPPTVAENSNEAALKLVAIT